MRCSASGLRSAASCCGNIMNIVSVRIAGIDGLLTDALNVNLANVGVRQNEDMRKMSAGAAIIAVPTAIAGIYGMNFRNMPELRSRIAAGGRPDRVQRHRRRRPGREPAEDCR